MPKVYIHTFFLDIQVIFEGFMIEAHVCSLDDSRDLNDGLWKSWRKEPA